MKRILWLLALALCILTGTLHAQTASFNFSAAPATVSGWTNVSGDPATGVRSATGASGITITSMSTANWAGYNNSCAFNGGGVANGSFFPSAVMQNQWFQYSGFYAAYNAAVPQLEIGGLNKDSVYTIKLAASFNTIANPIFDLNPTRYTVTGLTVYGNVDLNGNNNAANGAVFHNIAPDANGKIHIYVNTFGGSNTAGICGLQVIRERTAGLTPVVTLTHPNNNSILPEDGNVSITATASETGGSITKVEFYADSVKIGEDSTAPYAMTWVTPDPGSYVIKARAIDGFGNINIATINVTIQSLNYFWSTTGNIATGGDTSFVGTVDSNRLAFRTRNIERMNISPTGNVTINSNFTDSINHPGLRVYKNGDLTIGTTMDPLVNTNDQTGIRYYAKSGIMQIGATDRLDTSIKRAVYDNLPTSGLIINTDEPNYIKGQLMNTVFASTTTTFDTSWRSENAFIAMEHGNFTGGGHHALIRSFVGGYNNTMSADIDASIITGQEMQLSKPISIGLINGYFHSTRDTVNSSLVSGTFNQFGGLGQLVAGIGLVNKTPGGATLGRANVDFSSLPYTGFGMSVVANLGSYPLLALGNGINPDNTVSLFGEPPLRSNALTVLYNGRTQINTTGFNHSLSQSDVVPKAALDVVSTNTGVLLPRLTTAQRNAIASADLVNGLLLYNSDSSAFQFYNGTAWNTVGSGSSGQAGRWQYSNGTVFDTDDNVAIGTNDAKGYKLAVKGSALFTKVQVRALANWPDYVFDKSYRLRSLNALEAYIAKYKHLPEIISAVKAGTEGFDVATGQASILKKVEELTLYLIDENKQLKAQTSLLAEQNRKIAQQDKQIAEQNARFQDQQRQIDELKALLNKK